VASKVTAEIRFSPNGTTGYRHFVAESQPELARHVLDGTNSRQIQHPDSSLLRSTAPPYEIKGTTFLRTELFSVGNVAEKLMT
jgi:hypothetical protein